jgi:hypothetical protein
MGAQVTTLPEGLISSGTYTPTLQNITLGVGGTPVNSARWMAIGGPDVGDAVLLDIQGTIRLGTTGALNSSVPLISLPPGYTMSLVNPTLWGVGSCRLIDASLPGAWEGYLKMSTATTLGVYCLNVGGAYAVENGVQTLLPFGSAWTVDDRMDYHALIPVTRT